SRGTFLASAAAGKKSDPRRAKAPAAPYVAGSFFSTNPLEDPMQFRALGKTGLSIAPLVFGGNVFGWTADEKTSFDLLDAFTGAGFNAIDTADVYSRWAPGNQGGE